jgi:hypothetical protein
MHEEKVTLERERLAIVQGGRMSRGEYFEQVTRKYELRLELDGCTLFISLDIVGGKKFHLKVCDEGDHRLRWFARSRCFPGFSTNP